jgi:3',5'-cyclic AMP phosphodiesterase CpdA
MRTIVQISDLHFGRIDTALLRPLAQAIESVEPDLLAISGDLTQRARTAQFRDAASYLATLPQPQIVVPGNHDVPLYDILRRFLSPLTRFRRYICDDLTPFHSDSEIAVLGLNTARSLTFKGGRVNAEQMEIARQRFAGLPEDVTRIVVTHHPFDVPEQGDEADLVGRANVAMEAFAGCGVDLFLSGHMHHSHASSTAARYRIEGFAALVVQAGTATSTRGRGEANAFNVMRIGRTDMALETWTWQPPLGVFAPTQKQEFRFVHGKGWTLLASQDDQAGATPG